MDPKAVDAIYSSLAQATCIDHVSEATLLFTRLTGYEHFVCDFFSRDDGATQPFTLHNYANTWIERAARVPRSLYERDPVFAHLDMSPVPIVWNRDQYNAAGVGEIWEESSAAGISSGIAVAVECSRNIVLNIGLSRHDADRICGDESVLLRAHMSLFAACVKARAMDIVMPEIRLLMPRLTGRELDVLKWTREGKTAWELGKILGISNGTANFHLQNAQRKLASTDKHQAVLRALELQLID